MDVAAIKKANPSAIWKQVIDEYFNRKMQVLSRNPGSWGSYGEALGAAAGDPTSFVRSAIALLPSGSKWSINETRLEEVPDSIQWGPHRQTIFFLSVSYSNPETAPDINSRALRQTILEIILHGKTDGIISVSRVARADQYWPVPELAQAQAVEMTRAFLANRVRAFIRPAYNEAHRTDRWFSVSLPNYERPELQGYRQQFENAGFKTRNWTISPGWGANTGEVSPPESWRQYELVSEPGSVRYFLENDVGITVNNIVQKGNSATVTAHIRRNGCNEVCGLVKAYWSSDFAANLESEPGNHFNRFFMTLWDEYPDSNGTRGLTLSEEEDRTVSFEWKPRLGWAPFKQNVLALVQPRRLADVKP
jgi:hypothetical protein